MKTIPIKAAVGETEKAAILLAAESVEKSLMASNDVVRFACDIDISADALRESPESCIAITSLLSEASNYDEPWDQVEGRLLEFYRSITATNEKVVFVSTIFRHVPQMTSGQSDSIRIRIRRLNRFAAEVSRECGVMVADVDRDFADIGASRLRTDYLLSGPYAASVAAKTIALAIIANGLDGHVSFDALDAAKLSLANTNPAIALAAATDAVPSNIVSFGTGRRKQAVKTIVDNNSESHAGWLVHLFLSRQVSLSDAIAKLKSSISRRGFWASIALLLGAARGAMRSKKGTQSQ